MSLLLKQRDYVADGNGGVAVVRDGEALVNEALLPGLGSRMYQLRREKSSVWETLARQFAAEALAGLDGVTVTGAQVERQDDWLLVSVALLWQGTRLSVTVQLEG